MGAATEVNPLVTDYVNERADLINKITVLSNAARERGGDPSTDDLALISKMQDRVDQLHGFIKVLGRSTDMDEETEEKLRRQNPNVLPSVPNYRTDGQFMSDFMKATFGNFNDHSCREAKERYERVLRDAAKDPYEQFCPVRRRAAQHMGTDAAATTPTAGGVGALFVDPVVGPIINVLPTGQPFLTAIGKQQAPDSLTFLRPKVSDPNFDTAASSQGLQKAELRSIKFDVTTDSLTLDTIGGYLNVSQQLISLHPSGWDLILAQLRARVARAGELAALANLAQSTGSVTLASGATAAVTWAALVQAARMVAENTNMPPSWIAYGPKGWERLAGVTDTTGRPLFPFLGPVTAIGQASLDDTELSLAGLRPIYTTGLTTNAIWIGNSLTFEAFSYAFPVLESVEPSVLGRQVAVAEALAFYRPVTNGAVKVAP